MAFIRLFFSDLGILTLRFSRCPSFTAFLRSCGQYCQLCSDSTNGFTNLFGVLIFVSVSPKFLLSVLALIPTLFTVAILLLIIITFLIITRTHAVCLVLQLSSGREAYLGLLPLDRLFLFVGVERGSLRLRVDDPDSVRINGLPAFPDRLKVSFRVADFIECSRNVGLKNTR